MEASALLMCKRQDCKLVAAPEDCRRHVSFTRMDNAEVLFDRVSATFDHREVYSQRRLDQISPQAWQRNLAKGTQCRGTSQLAICATYDEGVRVELRYDPDAGCVRLAWSTTAETRYHEQPQGGFSKQVGWTWWTFMNDGTHEPHGIPIEYLRELSPSPCLL